MAPSAHGFNATINQVEPGFGTALTEVVQGKAITVPHDLLLDACRSNFGEPPRRFGLWDRWTYLNVPAPSWLRQQPFDKLWTFFRNLKTVYRDGEIVWGHIIQANTLLFSDGKDDCPGDVVYSLADQQSNHLVDLLPQIARDIAALKGTKPLDPGLLPIANHLTNEMTRIYGLTVPRSLCPTVSCRISTTFFIRKHLPKRRLCKLLIPLVVNTGQPFVAIPLPARYWPPKLIDWWTE